MISNGKLLDAHDIIPMNSFNGMYSIVTSHHGNHLHTMVLVPHDLIYHQTFNIRRTLVGNKIVDHSDVVGAAPVGPAPTTSSFST